MLKIYLLFGPKVVAQSAGTVEYTDKNPHHKFPGYDTKQSEGKVSVMLKLWECRVPLHCHRSQVHSDRVLYISQIELNCALMLN